ncbi:PilZ domain-containing protein [Methylobacterium sp. NEAU K]|uniref:PilZ domain-containing protein n=1 Tax=Methylobacterium sp. NEAU K TaxID=3064946 RepID=UPI00351F2DBC
MQQRREKLRVQATVEGRASLPGREADVRCIVLNFSPIGACLAFSAGTTVPRVFDLAIGAEPAASTVRVVWRREDVVGVAFLAPRARVPDVIPG